MHGWHAWGGMQEGMELAHQRAFWRVAAPTAMMMSSGSEEG